MTWKDNVNYSCFKMFLKERVCAQHYPVDATLLQRMQFKSVILRCSRLTRWKRPYMKSQLQKQRIQNCKMKQKSQLNEDADLTDESNVESFKGDL